MQAVETFGHSIDTLSETNPAQARGLLRAGWEVQNLRFLMAPNRALLPADRYLARLMMGTMLAPFRHPKDSALVGIFTPCELLQESGLSPYNVESFSCYLAASEAGRGMLQQTENTGISETLCSYHKTFLGAAERGILPKPGCVVYTNLACDANMLTFRRLAKLFQIPSFFIDIPMQQTRENVTYVAGELRELASFLEKQTKKTIDEDALKERLRRSRRTLENYETCQALRKDRYIPQDLASPLYAGIANHILLGTKEQERYTEMLLHDIRTAPPAEGKRLYWMHTIPFWSGAVRDALSLKESVQLVGCEFSQVNPWDFDPESPYEAMAYRMVYHTMNGGFRRRIENGIRAAKKAGADGAVWFCHWGCKHTLGAAQLAKKAFEKQGIPLLLLDGDGCDKSHGGEGQTATRLGAFLEMLGGGEHE